LIAKSCIQYTTETADMQERFRNSEMAGQSRLGDFNEPRPPGAIARSRKTLPDGRGSSNAIALSEMASALEVLWSTSVYPVKQI